MIQPNEYSGTADRKLICCLLALEIADYDAKPVFDQVRLTQDFHSLLSDATARANSDDVVSMIGEDGALLGFLADPEECFRTALTIREATLTQDRYRDLPLRIGVNLGKAQIAEDEFGHPHVSGEGKQDADRLMRQGPPRQISVAGHFVELLSRTAPELAALLEYQGLHSDSSGPPLGLYRVSAPQDAGSESLPREPPTPAVSADVPAVSSKVIDAPTLFDLVPIPVSAQSTAKSRNWLPRSWLGYALLPLLAGAAMVALSSRLHVEHVETPVATPAAQVAVATPQITTPEAPASLPAPVAPAESVPAPVAREESLPAPVAREATTRSAVTTPTVLPSDHHKPRRAASRRVKPTKQAALAAPHVEQSGAPSFASAAALEEQLERERRAGADQPIEAAPVQGAKSATLFLAVKPWGEVYVDGRKIGVTPPLKTFEIPLGRHLITITNSSLPMYQREVTVEPDAKVTVAHDFSCVSTREKVCREEFSKGRDPRSPFTLETTAEAAHQQ